jgi:hypothetical protein
VAKHIKGKKYLEENYEPHGEETSHAENDPLSFGLFTSPPHTTGDTRHGPRGPKLDMQELDGTDPVDWVSQMEHFFFLHNICTSDDKYQLSLVYLDAERWQWRQWHQQCIGGQSFPKHFVLVLIGRHTIWEG